MYGLSYHRTQYRGSSLGGDLIVYEGDSFKETTGGTGMVGTFFGDGGASERHFCTLPLPC